MADGRVFVIDGGLPREADEADLDALEEAFGNRDHSAATPPADWGSPRATVAEAVADGAETGARADARAITITTYQLRRAEVAHHRFRPDDHRIVHGPVDERISALADELAAVADRNVRGFHELVRGLVENAVVHRSYAPGRLGHAVAVQVFRDAVIIRSPGTPSRRVRVTRDRIEGRWSRNCSLARLLVPAGVGLCTGAAYAKAPHLAYETGWNLALSTVDHDFLVVLTPDPNAWARVMGEHRRRQHLPEGERTRRILNQLPPGAVLTAREIAALAGLPYHTARAEVGRMVAGGLLTPSRTAPRSPLQTYQRGPYAPRGPETV